VTLHNVSSRRLQLSVSAVSGGDSEALRFTVSPDRLVLRSGADATVTVSVSAPARVEAPLVTGTLDVEPSGGATVRIPFAIGFRRPPGNLLGRVSLSRTSFKPSDLKPSILTIRAGGLAFESGVQVGPVARLDVDLYDASGRFRGVLARLRDLLPGTYSFGITGRGANSQPLPPGAYELRLVAWPTTGAPTPPSRAQVRFRIQ
jgi:hypothetical protein